MSIQSFFKLFLVSLSLLTMGAFAEAKCVAPTSHEVQKFFNDESKWTEVRSRSDYRVAKKNPIYMDIDLADYKHSKVKMGDKDLSSKGVKFCREKNGNLSIKKPLFKITFTNHSEDLITSDDRINGELIYRQDAEVID